MEKGHYSVLRVSHLSRRIQGGGALPSPRNLSPSRYSLHREIVTLLSLRPRWHLSCICRSSQTKEAHYGTEKPTRRHAHR